MSRFLLLRITAALWTASAAFAAEPVTGQRISINVFLRARQTMVSAYEIGRAESLGVQKIPPALGCDWSQLGSPISRSISGTCKDWPSGNMLSLKDAVTELHQAGIRTIIITVTPEARGRQVKGSPAGWRESGYGVFKSYSFTSRTPQELPGDLELTPAPAAAEGDDGPDYQAPAGLTVNTLVTVYPNGRVRLSADAEGPEETPPRLLERVPGLIGCGDKSASVSGDSLTANCRELLKRTSGQDTGQLDLGRLVKGLRSEGVETVFLRVSTPAAATTAPKGWRLVHGTLLYESRTSDDVPPPLTFPLDEPADLRRFLITASIVIFGPLFLGCMIRIRRHFQPQFNWLVWFQWLQLGPLLYWVMAVRVADIDPLASLFIGDREWLRLPVAVVLAEGPLLVGMASAFVALRRLIARSRRGFGDLLRKVVLGQAALLVPLALFYQSSEIFGPGLASAMSLPAAYALYRGLGWLAASTRRRNVTPINSGPLYERTLVLAAKAGVKLSRLSIVESRSPEEINAFAISGGRVMLTESLVNNLTEREVDAVVAHEVGHHKAGHLRIPWTYLLFIGAFASGWVVSWAIRKFHLPQWIGVVPFPILLAMIANGLISQRNEYTADRHAAELTGDAEGKIAALGRLARVSGFPIARGGWLASIMTHPSMEERALALGRRFGLTDERALAIIRNPDEAYAGDLAPLARAVYASEPAGLPPVFSQRVRQRWVEQLRWMTLLVPLVSVAVVGGLTSGLLWFGMRNYRFGSLFGLSLLGSMVLGPVGALALLVQANKWVDRRFVRRMREGLAARLGRPGPEAVFAGLHPGHGIRSTEGFAVVDFGFVALENGWLCYRGEQFRFAIPRSDIFNVSIVSGPFRWWRVRRVEVEHAGGSFTLGNPATGTVDDMLEWLQEWRRQAPPVGEQRPEPVPMLPDLPGSASSRWGMAWYAAKESGKLLVLASVFGMLQWVGPALSTLWAPAVIVAYFAPSILWPNRPPGARRVPVERCETVQANSTPADLATD